MTTNDSGTGSRTGAARKPSATTHPTLAVIVTRPGDGWRSRRIRKLARRHLDALLGTPDPWDLAEPIDWAACHMDRTVPERAAIGRDMAAAGWMP